jgi:hypothetical protein
MLDRQDRLCALADSLPAAIRWRFSDYGQLLTKQLKMLAPPLKLVWPPRGEATQMSFVQRQCGRGDELRSAPSSVPLLPPGAE